MSRSTFIHATLADLPAHGYRVSPDTHTLEQLAGTGEREACATALAELKAELHRLLPVLDASEAPT